MKMANLQSSDGGMFENSGTICMMLQFDVLNIMFLFSSNSFASSILPNGNHFENVQLADLPHIAVKFFRHTPTQPL